jgi:fructose-bisphosphate aldolase, class II
MPVATAERFTEMLDAAAAGGYALPAVNVTSSQTLNAALRGFVQADSDGIVQVTVGGASYLSGGGDAAAGARGMAAFAREVADQHPVSVGVHTDHCPPEHVDDFLVPLLAASVQRRRDGEEPLFTSHMFDGSSLPLEENLALSSRLLETCRGAGVMLEVEVGAIGGEEDGVHGASGAYATTDELRRVAAVLGTGERGRYLLAAAFGNVHGVAHPEQVELRPAVLRDGQQALAETHHGARFAYVFHGSSGTAPDILREAIGYGVVKVNIDSDLQQAFTAAVAATLAGADMEAKKVFDPRSWGREAEAAMASRISHACEVLGSAGRST